MYQSRGLGQPYVMGSSGAIIDCNTLTGFLETMQEPSCWFGGAFSGQSYSMLDYTMQSSGLGPAASPATVAAVAADTQATVSQQCSDDPADCAIASSSDPVVASVVAGAQQAASDAASLATSALPSWLWAVLIGGGAFLVVEAMRR
jgi:hypothetical protein